MSFESNKFNNLIETEPERQREIARQGGIASGKARRIKRARQAYYSGLLDIAVYKDFATPEELKEFNYYRKNKDYIKEFKRYRKQFITWYNLQQKNKRKAKAE